MALSGVSGTHYTGLVGETGALSSGEMFARGGSTDHKYLNHSEDYEVRYAKGKNRHGYGNLRFDDGGALSKEDNYKRRLMFIRQDIDRVFENSPEKYLKTPVEGFENIETLLSNIQIASDYNDNESDNWSFSRGGATDHKYLNHSEDYEVRYAKGKNRHGYGNLKFANGGAMMANQQVIDDASQHYVNYYLNDGAVTGMYKQGGSIPNNYAGRSPMDIWNNLTIKQRVHFLHDHYNNPELYDFYLPFIKNNYEDLPKQLMVEFNQHIREGQYAKGAMVPSKYNVSIQYPSKSSRSNWASYDNVDIKVVAKSKAEAEKKALEEFEKKFSNTKVEYIRVTKDDVSKFDNFNLKKGGMMPKASTRKHRND
jgi:hypothetical protein